jgi:hypothetical protein
VRFGEPSTGSAPRPAALSDPTGRQQEIKMSSVGFTVFLKNVKYSKKLWDDFLKTF